MNLIQKTKPTAQQSNDTSDVVVGSPAADTRRFVFNKGITLVAFMVIFGGIGSYFLFSSFAATPPTWIISGNMAISSNNSKQTQLKLESAASYPTVTISPNGQRVAYTLHSTPDKLMTANLDGSNPFVVATLPTSDSTASYFSSIMRWSPDSTKIAMAVSVGPTLTTGDIWVIAANGTGSKHISVPDGSLANQHFSWLSNTAFLYTKSSQLCTIQASGTGQVCKAVQNVPTSVTKPGLCGGFDFTNPMVSPDGTKVVVYGSPDCAEVSSATGLYTANIDGTGLRQVRGLTRSSAVFSSAWSPDGTQIAYVLETYGTSNLPIRTLYVMPADGSGTIGGTSYGPVADLSISWGAANALLVAQSLPSPVIPSAKFVNGRIVYGTNSSINADGSAKQATNETDPQKYTRRTLSPDGSQMAYYAWNFTTSVNDLMIASVDGSYARTVVADVGSWSGLISWSNDGRQLAFEYHAKNDPTSTVSIALVYVSGTGLRVLPATSRKSNQMNGVAWFQDSNTLAFIDTSTSPHRLYMVKADGSGQSYVDLVNGVQFRSPKVSPDNTKVLLMGTYATKGIGYSNVYAVTVGDGSIANITNRPTPVPVVGASFVDLDQPVWSPDGKYIAFAQTDMKVAACTSAGCLPGSFIGIGNVNTPGINSGLYVMNANGTNSVRVDTTYPFNLVWQPKAVGYFTSITPNRIVDTRPGAGPGYYGGQTLASGKTLDIQVAGAGNVPLTGVTSVVLNVTAIGSVPGFVSVFPSGTAVPNASTVNLTPNVAVNNQTVATLGTNGKVSIFNAVGTTNVIVDVVGYYSAAGNSFVPVTSARITDTRPGSGKVNAGKTLKTGTVLKVGTSGVGGVPAGATGVIVDVTVTNASANSFLTLYPSNVAIPGSSSLNYVAGQNLTKEVNVKLASDGTFAIANSFGSVDAIVDVVGYYTAGTANAAFVGLNPVRLVDTRTSFGGTKVAAGGTLSVGVAGKGGVPAGAKGVVLNVTVPSSTSWTFLAAYPSGTAVPDSSNITYNPGQVAFNEITVKLGSDGKFNLYNATGTTDVIVDVLGYYL